MERNRLKLSEAMRVLAWLEKHIDVLDNKGLDYAASAASKGTGVRLNERNLRTILEDYPDLRDRIVMIRRTSAISLRGLSDQLNALQREVAELRAAMSAGHLSPPSKNGAAFDSVMLDD